MHHDTINRKDASVRVAGQTPSGHEEKERSSKSASSACKSRNNKRTWTRLIILLDYKNNFAFNCYPKAKYVISSKLFWVQRDLILTYSSMPEWVASWHLMVLEENKLWQKTHLCKPSHSTPWCENSFLTLQSAVLNLKGDFGCETKGIHLSYVNILCHIVYINVYVQIHWRQAFIGDK